MGECRRGDKVLEVLMTGDVSDREIHEAQEHAKECSSCAEVWEVHDRMHALDAPAASDGELLAMRRGVIRAIRTAEELERSQRGLGYLLARPMVALPIAALVLVIGVVIGRSSGRQGPAGHADDPTSITHQLEYAAARGTDESGDRPFSFSNVRLEEVDASTVRMSFDAAARLEIIRAKDDPLVAEVLVQSLTRRQPVATRLDAIDAAARLAPRVRDALITTMREDQSLAVRLRAIKRLTAEPDTSSDEGELRQALLDVLRFEKSVRMRLLAIDHLTRYRVSPGALEEALSEGQPEPGTAIYTKAERYLRTLDSSHVVDVEEHRRSS